MVTKTEKQTKHVVDVVFVGGGPATLGLLANACRNNKLNELVGKGDGIAILEANMSLGAGCLAGFGINSNTSANGFIKCLYKRREIQQQQRPNANVTPNQNKSKAPASTENLPEGSPLRKKLKEKNCGLEEDDSEEGDLEMEDEVYQPQKYEYVALNPFVDLYKSSPLIQMSFEFGPSIIPLSAVGMILNWTGNHLLQFIHKVYGRRVFFPHHRVVSVQMLPTGECITTAIRQECSLIVDPPSENSEGQLPETPGYQIIKHAETQVTFRSKAVVMSNGGVQSTNPDFYKWFPCLSSRKEDVVLSDYFLQKAGFIATMRRIRVENKRKIVIIGGSHSGFSAAVMMLNGPSSLLRNTSVIPTVQHVWKNTGKFNFPGAIFKTIDGCTRCCSCSYLKKDKMMGAKDKCSCVCRCYGYFKYSDWGFDYSNDLPNFEDGSIKILYRSKIRVFYNKVSAAAADGYNEYKPTVFSNKNGYLYSFTGLRGDAKKLYKSVVKGEEKRVRLILAPTPQDQLKHIEEADLVIVATGYQTNPIIVRDTDQKIISMQTKVPYTQCDVDQKCRIITNDNMILTKIFGSGLAYPLRTNDGMIVHEAGQPNPRADSFSLYMNFVANTMLSNLLPKTKIDHKMHKTNRPNRKGLAQPQQSPNKNQNANNTMQRNNSRSGNNVLSQGTTNSLSRQTNQSTVNKVGIANNSKPAVFNKQPTSPRTTPSIKVGVSNLSTQKEAVRNNSSSSPRPTSTGAIRPEVRDTFVASGEIGQSGQTPGYLAMNYSSQARAVSNQPAQNTKKQAWIPSSQYQGPPINRIPRDTAKAIEQRIAIQNERDKQRSNIMPPPPFLAAGSINQIAGITSDFKEILAESASVPPATLSMTDAIQLYSGAESANQNIIAQTGVQAFPLKTTAFQNNQLGEGLDAVNNLPTTAYALGSSFKLTNQNINPAQQNTFYNQTTSLDRSLQTSPQKNVVASPLIYNKKAKLVDNTPQVHRRKASFKLVTSGGKELNSSQSIAITSAGNNVIQQVDYVQQTSMMMNTNQINSKLITQVSESHANSKISNFAQNQIAHSPVKPASQSQIKRHSNSTSNTKKKGSKKNITSAQKQAAQNTNFIAEVGDKFASYNQKSSPNIKAKRIGAFAKNQNSKQLQQQDQSAMKSNKQGFPEQTVLAQQSQPLSNLASAGQRQIFSDDSVSVSSAKRMEQMNRMIAPRQGVDLIASTQIPKSISTIEQLELGGSQTPKQNAMPAPVQSQLTSSNSRRRSTLNTIKNHARNLPMNDNFVTSYVEKSQHSLAESVRHSNNASHSKLVTSRKVQLPFENEKRNQSSQENNRENNQAQSYSMPTQTNFTSRRERVTISSHKERRETRETPLQDELDASQLNLVNQNSVNHVFRTPQKRQQAMKNAYSIQQSTGEYQVLNPQYTGPNPSATMLEGSPNQLPGQKSKSIPRTQRKSTYQPGILIQNPVISSAQAEGDSPIKQQNAYQKQIQANLNQVSQQLNYLDMTSSSDGRANSTSVVPVKVFHLPITAKQDQNSVTTYHQVQIAVGESSAAQNPATQIALQNVMVNNNTHKQKVPQQANPQPNSNVANYGLMYVNPQQAAGMQMPMRAANTMAANNTAINNINKSKSVSMTVAQQFHNSPIKMTPAKLQMNQVTHNNGLNMYIAKPTVVQNAHSSQSPQPIPKQKANPVEQHVSRVLGVNQPPTHAQQLAKSYKQQYMQQQQIVKQSAALV